MNIMGTIILVGIFMTLGMAGLLLLLALRARARQRAQATGSLAQVIHSLPRWPIRQLLAQVDQELSLLQTGAEIAHQAGVPASLTDRVSLESRRAVESLRQSAERIAAAAAQRVDYAALAPYLQREEARLISLAEAIRHTREGLAGLTLAMGEEDALEMAETRLRILGQAASAPLPVQESSPVAAIDGAASIEAAGASALLEGSTPGPEQGSEPILPAAAATGRLFWTISAETAQQLVLLRSFSGAAGALSFAFSPDGSALLALSVVDGVQLWQVEDGKLVRQVVHSGVQPIALSPVGDRLATGASDGSIHLWRVSDGEPLHTLIGHQSAIGRLAFSRDGSLLASEASDSTVRLWRVHDGAFLYDLAGAAPDQQVISFFPLEILGLVADRAVQLWKAGDGLRPWTKLRNQEKPRDSSLCQVGLAPDGTMLSLVEYCEYIEYAEDLTGHGIGHIHRLRTWNIAGEPHEVPFSDRLAGEPAKTGIAYAPDSQKLVWSVGNNLSLLRLGPDWVREGIGISRLRGHTAAVNSFSFAPDSSLLVSGADDATVRLWQTADGALLRTLEGHSQPVHQVSFSPDGLLLGTASLDGTVQCWGVPV